MCAKSILEEFLHLVVAALVYLLFGFPAIFAIKQRHVLLSGLQNIDEFHCCCVRFGPLVHEYDDLLPHFEYSYQIVEDYVVHDIIASCCITHFLNTVKRTLKRCRPVRCVECKRALSISTDEVCNIGVIW